MNINHLKSEILEYIESHDGTTFVEIENIFEENNFNYKGDGAYTSGQHPNVVFGLDGTRKHLISLLNLNEMD